MTNDQGEGVPEDEGVDPNCPADSAPSRVVARRRRWTPELETEIGAALRTLAARPWLFAGRDDAIIQTIRRNAGAVAETFGRLGWGVIIERDFVRLRKSPPVRRQAWAESGPTPLQASWFFLLVAAAETVPPRVSPAQLVTAGRAAAAEAGLQTTNDIGERRAILFALTMLDRRGVVTRLDGDLEEFVDDEAAPVLLEVQHKRLAHVIAHFGPFDPVREPEAWLEAVEREPDVARRMRRRLVDDAVVHACDLNDVEADWLSRRVRGDDGGPLAAAFGLHVERRAEGAAFVVPEEAFRHLAELGPAAFPAPGTVPHAALLVCEHASAAGVEGDRLAVPGPGWRGLRADAVLSFLVDAIARRPEGRGGWSGELVEAPEVLAGRVRELLEGLDLLRVRGAPDSQAWWWVSPATSRWRSVGDEPKRAASRSSSAGRRQLGLGWETPAKEEI